jgi:hypothetical protein
MMGKALQPSRVGTAFCAHAGSINHIPISHIASHRPYRRIGHAHIDETSNIRCRVGTKGRTHPAWLDVAAIPERIRGFVHVKIANVALAREREMALLHWLDPMRYPKPATGETASADGGVKVHWIAKSREETCVRE